MKRERRRLGIQKYIAPPDRIDNMVPRIEMNDHMRSDVRRSITGYLQDEDLAVSSPVTNQEAFPLVRFSEK